MTKNATTSKRRPKTFAALLAEFRKISGLTVYELADKTGLHRQTIYAIECGRNRPTWDVVQILANAFGVSTEVFRTIHAKGGEQ